MYIYCQGNPIAFTDPAGESTIPVFDIKINPSELILEEGQTKEIKIDARYYFQYYNMGITSSSPEDNVTGSVKDKNVEWCDNNESIASRSSDTGKSIRITGKKAGTTTINVRATWWDWGFLANHSSSKSASITVKAKPKVTGVTVSPTAKTLLGGRTVQLSATVTPSSVSQGVTWRSSDTSIATVDKNGKVTANSTGKGGSAYIYAKSVALNASGNKVESVNAKSCKITVNSTVTTATKTSAAARNKSGVGARWPLTEAFRITQRFGNSNHIYTSGTHGGIDVSGSGISGKPIIAIADGIIRGVDKGYPSPSGNGTNPANYNHGGGFGNHVVVEHTIGGNKYWVFYAHMLSCMLGEGDIGKYIKVGQQIGTVGNSGYSIGTHLHLEFRLNNKYGTKKDPMQFFNYLTGDS
jgi:murein DD-endopeptidase MepM/ murein hydrolase activator NlpD